MGLNLSMIATEASAFLKAVQPYVDAAVGLAAPEAAPAVSVGEKIVQGVLAGTPEAVALYQQVTTGTPLSADQVKALEVSYEADYQQLKADIATKLKTAV